MYIDGQEIQIQEVKQEAGKVYYIINPEESEKLRAAVKAFEKWELEIPSTAEEAYQKIIDGVDGT